MLPDSSRIIRAVTIRAVTIRAVIPEKPSYPIVRMSIGVAVSGDLVCANEGSSHMLGPQIFNLDELKLYAEVSYEGKSIVKVSVIADNFCCVHRAGYSTMVYVPCRKPR